MSNAILYAGLSFMLRPVRLRHQLVPVANRDDLPRIESLTLDLLLETQNYWKGDGTSKGPGRVHQSSHEQ